MLVRKTALTFACFALLLSASACEEKEQDSGEPPNFLGGVITERSDEEDGAHIRYKLDVEPTPSGGEAMAQFAISFSKKSVVEPPRVTGRSPNIQKWTITTTNDSPKPGWWLISVDGKGVASGVSPGEEAWVDFVVPTRKKGATLTHEVFMNTRESRTLVHEIESKSLSTIMNEAQ